MRRKKIVLSRVIQQKGYKTEYHIIGYLSEIPQVGEELKYYSLTWKKCHAQEIIEKIELSTDKRYPGRMKIETNWNTFIADNLVEINEKSRGRRQVPK